MTITHLIQRDTVNDLGLLISRSSKYLENVGIKTASTFKFILYDVTLSLNKLPFGNWISLAYFLFMTLSIKNVVEGGELNRIVARAIDLYFIQQKTFSECFNLGQHYLWRLVTTQISDVQSFAYGVMTYTWEYTSTSIKQEVKRIAKEIVLDNANDIEKTVNEFAKTAVFTAIVTTISQQIIKELGPVAAEAFSKSFAESVSMISESETRGHENNILLNQKLTEISMQLEYLRVNQPAQFREMLNTISLSTLALNDVGLHSTLVDTLAKITGAFGSSLSQKGQRRIENIQ